MNKTEITAIISFLIPVILMARIFVSKSLSEQVRNAIYTVVAVVGYLAVFQIKMKMLIYFLIIILMFANAIQILNQRGKDEE